MCVVLAAQFINLSSLERFKETDLSTGSSTGEKGVPARVDYRFLIQDPDDPRSSLLVPCSQNADRLLKGKESTIVRTEEYFEY